MSNLYDLKIRDHFMPYNFDHGRSAKVRLIVIHHNAGHGVDPYKTWTTGGREASAHYQVWGDGDVDQLVRVSDTAWHAHEANPYSVGIEHENLRSGGQWPIDERGLHASAKLVGYLCAHLKLGTPRFGDNVTTHNAVESDGRGVDSGTACPGPFFIKILKNPDHWYWAEARAAYRGASGEKPSAPAKPPKPFNIESPFPYWKRPGHVIGRLDGPARYHGGATAAEKSQVRAVVGVLRILGYKLPPGLDTYTRELEQVVHEFQVRVMGAKGKKATGQVGLGTWRALRGAYRAKRAAK